MSSDYRESDATDYLDAIRKAQAEAKNKNSSASNTTLTYVKPVNSEFSIATAIPTATAYTLGDYNIVDNTSKLVAFLPFDLDVLDASNSNDGTVTGTETYVTFDPEISSTHPIRKAFSFNGSSYITLANESNFDFDRYNAFSISFWVKMGTIGADQGLICKSNDLTTGLGWKVYFQNSSDLIVFKIADGVTAYSITSTTSLTTSVWCHIVCTFNGLSNRNGMKLYVNGSLETTGTGSTISNTVLNSVSVVLGAESDGGSLFTGYMDDLQIWSTELTSSNVTDLYTGKQVYFEEPYGTLVTEDSITLTTEDSVDITTEKDSAIKPAIISFSDVT